jgi:diaminopimelate epimerase
MVRPHLTGLSLYKMTGSGNDFAMIDARLSSPEEWSSADIRAICSRGTGVGADGLVFVGPGSQPGSIRMIYFNSDGSRAAMCGNAALCSTRLAARLGIGGGSSGGEGAVPAAPTDAGAVGGGLGTIMRLETDAGTYEARCGPGDDEAELHLEPIAAPVAVPDLEPGDAERSFALSQVGVPHLVVMVDNVEQVDLAHRGRELRYAAALGPAGANVNFVSQTGEDGQWYMRTYERGVEGETLACGTGSVAVACALESWGLARFPVSILTRSGRRLEVRGRRLSDGSYDDLWLAGEARLVFRGVLT